jgi:hypothetical protein
MNKTKSLKCKIAKFLLKYVLRPHNYVPKSKDLSKQKLTLCAQLEIALYIFRTVNGQL